MRDRPSERDWSSLRNREWRPTAPPEETGNGGGSSSSSGGRGQGRGSGSQAGRGRGSSSNSDAVGRGAAASVAPPESAAVASKASQNASSLSGSNRVNTDIVPPPAKEKEVYRAPRGDQARWLTDAEISSTRNGKKSERKELVRWQAVDPKEKEMGGSLEELEPIREKKIGAKPSKEWDQFKANEELFGYKSTFKSDLSQYTTPLNVKNLPAEVKHKAALIAKELEGGWSKQDLDTGNEYEEEDEGDEENLFSAVPRNDGYQDDYHEEDGGHADGGMGGALLASLRAGPAAAEASTGCNYRSLIAPKVQSWWRARRQSGADVLEGCEDALICPFSGRVFGDVSQLVTHWAAALPRPDDGKSETPCNVATEQFRRAGEQLSFSEMLADTGLETVMPVTSPRAGSVWAQVVTKLDVRGKSSGSPPLMERKAADIVSEAVQMKCWRRDQKVEHREVLEGIAAGLALYILNDTSGSWSPARPSSDKL